MDLSTIVAFVVYLSAVAIPAVVILLAFTLDRLRATTRSWISLLIASALVAGVMAFGGAEWMNRAPAILQTTDISAGLDMTVGIWAGSLVTLVTAFTATVIGIARHTQRLHDNPRTQTA